MASLTESHQFSMDARRRAIAKRAATILRHHEEPGVDTLAQIRAQTADGTLVIRDITSAERGPAYGAAGRTSPSTNARAPADAKAEERHRIADGVHDDSLQAVCAVGLGLANLRRQTNDPEAIDALQRLQETVKFASQRLRSLLFDLRPTELEHDGLGPTLQAYLERAERDEGLGFTLDDQLTSAPDLEMRLFLFGVAQELLMNVRKHAHASRVDVSLTARDGLQVVRVHDDGVGFDVAEARRARPGHLGLAALSERLQLADGMLHIQSAPGVGTTIEFEVPTPVG
jgi:signal transduction histidine kinase